MNIRTDLQGNYGICFVMMEPFGHYSAVVKYFLKGKKEISVLIPLRLKAMGKLDKDMKTSETKHG